MLRTMTLMLTLATIAVLMAASVAHSETLNIVRCKERQVCKGTDGPDWIFGTSGNDRILPMSGEDYVFGNGANDDVAHSYDADMIFGGCGSDTVRGGGGSDTIYANMPSTLRTDTPTCLTITQPLDSASIDAIKALDPGVQTNDVPDRAHDLVDCAWLSSRDEPRPDLGFGQVLGSDTVKDTVVDCYNRDDQ